MLYVITQSEWVSSLSRQAAHPYTYEFCYGRVPYLDHYNDVWSEKNLTGLDIQNAPSQMSFKGRRSHIISHVVTGYRSRRMRGLLSPRTLLGEKRKEKKGK